jgi:hypothetical protein
MNKNEYMICPVGNILGNLWKVKYRDNKEIIFEKIYHSRSDFDFFTIIDNKVILKVTEHKIKNQIYYQYHIQDDKNLIPCNLIPMR